jgi:hypothetical protein
MGGPARVLVRNWCGPRQEARPSAWAPSGRCVRQARCGTASIQGDRIEQCVPMAKFDSPYDRVRKLPKQFKPLRAYEEERRRGVAHTPEYDEQMRVLKEEFQRWLLAE